MAMAIKIRPEIKTNLSVASFIVESLLPIKMPNERKAYWQIAVAIGRHRWLNPSIDNPIPEPIESIDKAKPIQTASASSIFFEPFISANCG